MRNQWLSSHTVHSEDSKTHNRIIFNVKIAVLDRLRCMHCKKPHPSPSQPQPKTVYYKHCILLSLIKLKVCTSPDLPKPPLTTRHFTRTCRSTHIHLCAGSRNTSRDYGRTKHWLSRKQNIKMTTYSGTRAPVRLRCDWSWPPRPLLHAYLCSDSVRVVCLAARLLYIRLKLTRTVNLVLRHRCPEVAGLEETESP